VLTHLHVHCQTCSYIGCSDVTKFDSVYGNGRHVVGHGCMYSVRNSINSLRIDRRWSIREYTDTFKTSTIVLTRFRELSGQMIPLPIQDGVDNMSIDSY